MNDTLQELIYAHRIIKVMLNHMTLDEKVEAARVLEENGVSEEGMTRFHERRAVIQREITLQGERDVA